MFSKRSPEEFSQVLATIDSKQSKRPPVEKWRPSHEVSVDISIDGDGQWFYEGRPMERQALVSLFASVIRKEGDEYYLVTPVEKALLTVEDVPFVIVDWEHYLDNSRREMVVVHSNMGHQVVLSEEFPMTLKRKTIEGHSQHVPYVSLGNGLEAKVRRSVYYQMVENGEQVKSAAGTKLVLYSHGVQFQLGEF